jgi:hypothetical protein
MFRIQTFFVAKAVRSLQNASGKREYHAVLHFSLHLTSIFSVSVYPVRCEEVTQQ